MWCQHCQQDVPTATVDAHGDRRCSRCLHETDPPFEADAPQTVSMHADPLADLLDGKSAQRIKEIGHKLASQPKARAGRAEDIRFDAPHFKPAAEQSTEVAEPTETQSYTPSPVTQTLAWLATFVGGVLLATGSVAVATTLTSVGAGWWSWGLAGIFLGQSLVLIGLVAVLFSLWTSSRASQQQLRSAERQLLELRRTAEALVGQRHPSAASFYASLAREANPHTLLASLQGQIDELVTRLNADI